MKKEQGVKVQKKKKRFLKRSNPIMIRFSDDELKEYQKRVKRSGLSHVEFCRRKVLDVPIANID